MQQYFRVATSPAALVVQNWLTDKFESYGYNWSENISIHKFVYNNQQLDAGNVVVIKKGTKYPNEYIMITSHYDHSTFSNPVGPGADDNASGTSGVLECARLLKNFPTERSIMFVPFNGEEFWMIGSLPFAEKCATENMNIIAHFNMDMIGWFPTSIPTTIMASGYSEISKPLFEYFQQSANTYNTSIPTIRLSAGDSYGGDHMPFNMYEYPSLYIGDIEYHAIHPCYHKSCDSICPTPTSLNCGVNRLDLAKAFVQSTLSAAAELANAWLPPQNFSACSGIDKITLSWESSEQNNSYKIFKNDELLAETPQNFYVDYDVEVGKNYEYYVKDLSGAPSNKDKITFVEPLTLPYSNNFNENRSGFEQSNWVIRNQSGKNSLCNTSENDMLPDNYLSMAELDWFSIPYNTDTINIRFKWRGTLEGIWYNAALFFEVTKDRKTWHKLASISGNINNWQEQEFSLLDFVKSDFFQVRFRLESSGSQSSIYTKIGFFTDFEIDFVLGTDTIPPDTTRIRDLSPYISYFSISPNPAQTYINIETDQQEPYHIAIYDIYGRLVSEQERFRDGLLSVAHLRKGTYLVVASSKQHRIAKKLIIQ